jgi:branched-chain amino acid transport system substrate-binding protein
MLRRLLALTIALVAIAAPASSADTTPYTIDVILSQTGPLAFIGNGFVKSLRVYESWANRHGGVRGRPIAFQFNDDQSSPQVAVQLAHTLIDKHPLAILGSDNGSICGAMSAFFKDGPVQFCLVPSINPPKDGYVFASGADLVPYVAGMIRYMRLRGWQRLAVITAVGGSGTADDVATAEVLKQPENANVRVVTWEHFNPTDLELSAQAAHVKNSDAQAVLVWAAGSPFGTVLRNLNDVGWTLPVETSSANMYAAQMSQYGSIFPKELVMPAPAYFAQDIPASSPLRRAVEDMLAAHRDAAVSPDPGSLPYVWDAADIIVSGLRQLGPSASPKALRDYILKLKNRAGINGIYDFSRGDQHGLSEDSVVMAAWDPAAKQFVAVSGLRGVPVLAR